MGIAEDWGRVWGLYGLEVNIEPEVRSLRLNLTHSGGRYFDYCMANRCLGRCSRWE